MGNKSYEYRLFNDSSYVGNIPSVLSDFNYQQTINSAATELRITVGKKFADLGMSIESDQIVDDAGDSLVDDVGNSIVSDTSISLDDIPIDVGNSVQVYETSDTYPNGVKVFEGRIVSWEADDLDDITEVSCLSNGYQLKQHVISEGADLNLEQTQFDSEFTLTVPGGKGTPDQIGQTFQFSSDTEVGTIGINIHKDSPTLISMVRLTFGQGTPASPGATLATIVRSITNTDAQIVPFNLPQPTGVIMSTDYYWKLESANGPTSDYTPAIVSYQSSDVYASGTYYENLAGAGWSTQTRDFAFNVETATGSILYPFSNIDSGLGVRQAMDIFHAQGGLVLSDEDTIEQSGVNMNYDFNIATMQSIIDKALAVAPSTFYYYVNVADSYLYFKDRSDTPDHTLVNGYHLTGLKIMRTIDELANTVYLTGGDDGSGSNLVVLVSNEASQAQFGLWTDIITDSRVTTQSTAERMANARLDGSAEPKFRVRLSVSSQLYDTTSINIGDTIRITNHSELLDEYMLQVVEKEYTPYELLLTLGSVEPRTSTTISYLSDQLETLYKNNNASTLT